MLVSGGASASRGVERCGGHPRIERCSAVPTELCDGKKGIFFPILQAEAFRRYAEFLLAYYARMGISSSNPVKS